MNKKITVFIAIATLLFSTTVRNSVYSQPTYHIYVEPASTVNTALTPGTNYTGKLRGGKENGI